MQNRCRKNLIGLLQWLPLCAGLMQGELKVELLLSDIIVFRVWKTPKGWFRACLVIVSSYCVFANTQNRSQSSLKHGKKFNSCLRKEQWRNIIIKEKETRAINMTFCKAQKHIWFHANNQQIPYLWWNGTTTESKAGDQQGQNNIQVERHLRQNGREKTETEKSN